VEALLIELRKLGRLQVLLFLLAVGTLYLTVVAWSDVPSLLSELESLRAIQSGSFQNSSTSRRLNGGSLRAMGLLTFDRMESHRTSTIKLIEQSDSGGILGFLPNREQVDSILTDVSAIAVLAEDATSLPVEGPQARTLEEIRQAFDGRRWELYVPDRITLDLDSASSSRLMSGLNQKGRLGLRLDSVTYRFTRAADTLRLDVRITISSRWDDLVEEMRDSIGVIAGYGQQYEFIAATFDSELRLAVDYRKHGPLLRGSRDFAGRFPCLDRHWEEVAQLSVDLAETRLRDQLAWGPMGQELQVGIQGIEVYGRHVGYLSPALILVVQFCMLARLSFISRGLRAVQPGPQAKSLDIARWTWWPGGGGGTLIWVQDVTACCLLPTIAVFLVIDRFLVARMAGGFLALGVLCMGGVVLWFGSRLRVRFRAIERGVG